jgi:hypothetical protein
MPGAQKRGVQQSAGRYFTLTRFQHTLLAAWQAGRPDLIRSPRLVLAHVWEGVEVCNSCTALTLLAAEVIAHSHRLRYGMSHTHLLVVADQRLWRRFQGKASW